MDQISLASLLGCRLRQHGGVVGFRVKRRDACAAQRGSKLVKQRQRVSTRSEPCPAGRGRTRTCRTTFWFTVMAAGRLVSACLFRGGSEHWQAYASFTAQTTEGKSFDEAWNQLLGRFWSKTKERLSRQPSAGHSLLPAAPARGAFCSRPRRQQWPALRAGGKKEKKNSHAQCIHP